VPEEGLKVTTAPTRDELDRYVRGLAGATELERIELALLSDTEVADQIEQLEEELTRESPIRQRLMHVAVARARTRRQRRSVLLAVAALAVVAVSAGVLWQGLLSSAQQRVWAPRPTPLIGGSIDRSASAAVVPIVDLSAGPLVRFTVSSRDVSAGRTFDVRIAAISGETIATYFKLSSTVAGEIVIDVPASLLRVGRYLLFVLPDGQASAAAEFRFETTETPSRVATP
jgi:hypothetical protein